MRILMMTNTYLPHVGGVARSVAAFADEYRRCGHEVLVAAPEFEGQDPDETGVIRIAALQKFNGSDFSVVLPAGDVLDDKAAAFEPDVIHSHHPFLLGTSAQRLAALHNVPLVFTHHTMYEQYTHYVPADSNVLKRFVTALSTDYANLANLVFAPSASVATILRERGVNTAIEVVPTGLATGFYTSGSRTGMRAVLGIPRDAFVIGYVGRLAPEKNLEFLTAAVSDFLRENPHAWFVVAGEGPLARSIQSHVSRAGVADRVVLTGSLGGALLASTYRAMDVFAFASTSETQGMVLTEAMAARTPVVAIDSPGVRDVVVNEHNGLLLHGQSATGFRDALRWVATRDAAASKALQRAAYQTAKSLSINATAGQALKLYDTVCGRARPPAADEADVFAETLNRISIEWNVVKSLVEAAGKALMTDDPEPRALES